jgi:hypothetical protein
MTTPVTRLIRDQSAPPSYTAVRLTDTRTALTRGLAEYLAQLSVEGEGSGRDLWFRQVFETWPEPETQAQYPAAIVYAPDLGSYDSSKFTPMPNARNRLAGTNMYLLSHSEFVQDLRVEIWTTDLVSRREIVSGLEAAFNPVSWMYGFKLELPHYYNERAVFELKSMRYMDTEEDAMRRYRKAEFVLTASVPLVNVFEFPEAKPKFRLDEAGPDVVITGPNVVVDC